MNVRTIVFLVGAALVLGGIPVLMKDMPQIEHTRLRDKVGKSVVMITNQERTGGGTGFYVKGPSGAVYILTNSHICNFGVDRHIDLYVNGNVVRAIEISETSDLCIMSLPRGPASIPDALSVRNAPIYKGELINAIGHPQLLPLTLTTGEYQGDGPVKIAIGMVMNVNMCPTGTVAMPTDFAGLFICVKEYVASFTTILIQPGNSGSPAVDSNGNVVGVIFAGDTSGRAVIVTLDDIKLFLRGR